MVISVADEPAAHEYVITVDGRRAGEIVYVLRQGRRVFLHTVIDPAFEGRGVGKQAVTDVLEISRRLGERIVPMCPFVAAFIDRTPQYGDLVDQDMLDSLRLQQGE